MASVEKRGRAAPPSRGDRIGELHRRIVDDIAAGVILPDSVVQLGVLAERYEVPRTPVREALTLLEIEGAVTAIPRKGYLVRGIEPGDVHDVHVVRCAIEGAGAALAAERMSHAALEKLTAVHRAEDTDSAAVSRSGPCHDFHMAVMEASGSARLLALSQAIYHDVRRLLAAGLCVSSPEQTHTEHVSILRALVHADPRGAQEAMEGHLKSLRARTVRAWLEPSGSG